jgi:hypothetical protein
MVEVVNVVVGVVVVVVLDNLSITQILAINKMSDIQESRRSIQQEISHSCEHGDFCLEPIVMHDSALVGTDYCDFRNPTLCVKFVLVHSKRQCYRPHSGSCCTAAETEQKPNPKTYKLAISFRIVQSQHKGKIDFGDFVHPSFLVVSAKENDRKRNLGAN